MAALVPIVEVAHHADHFGVGRPNREARAMHAFALDQVRAHGAIAFVLRAFAVNVEIEIGDQRREPVGVLDFHLRAVP